MSTPTIDGLLARKQHEFIKARLLRLDKKARRLGLAEVLHDKELERKMISEIIDEMADVARYIDLLTEVEGYKALQGLIDQQKLLPLGGGSR